MEIWLNEVCDTHMQVYASMCSNGIYQGYVKIGTEYSQHMLGQDELLLTATSMTLMPRGMEFLPFH